MHNSLRGLEKHVLIPAGTRAETHEGPWDFVAAFIGTSTQRKGVV
jgi:hypothetical protein